MADRSLAESLLRSFTCRDAESHALVSRIANDMQGEHDKWIASLRAQGVKAAHPDDGWVDRKANTIQFAYCQFNDGAKAGDLMALGWPQGRCARPQHRIVRLIESVRAPLFPANSRWKFEEVPHG